ncbi:MAG TPA: glycosyltransferase family 39 protein [Candidatus Acidoferrales bacterium]|nr:glycosyltransferase family 39 protein [Candidatus Acidoferrales bacterium]
MSNGNRGFHRKLFWMFAVALLVRLVVMAYTYPLQLVPARDHWPFAYETGRIARSIVQGKGFSSPLFGDTGPTAWMTPVYPYILAGVFKVFGVFTKTSALVMLSLNGLISALTCLPIFSFVRKSFGEQAAEWAAWIWALFPYEVYWPVARIWDTWLATLLLAILFCVALRLAESDRVRDWVGFGVLSGIAALTDPIVLTVLPLLALWALWRLHKTNHRSLKPAMGAVLAVILVVSPWFIRNDRVFHQFIPFRDVFPLALRVGNVGDQFNLITLTLGPWESGQQWSDYQKYGEIAYMQRTWSHATSYIAGHPGQYARFFVRRIVYVWTRFWYLIPTSRYGYEPEPAVIFLYTALSILAFIGLRVGSLKGVAVAPYAIVLIFFPIVYYGTSIEPWYSSPMDPFLMGLAGGAIACLGSTQHLASLFRVSERHLPSDDEIPEETESEELASL